MKNLSMIAAMFALAIASANLQAEDKPGMSHSMQGKGKMHMSPEQMDAHMRAMQEHMLTMHDYSNKILAEKDPAKKEKLKAEQLELMKAHHMQMMAHRKQMKEMKQKQGK